MLSGPLLAILMASGVGMAGLNELMKYVEGGRQLDFQKSQLKSSERMATKRNEMNKRFMDMMLAERADDKDWQRYGKPTQDRSNMLLGMMLQDKMNKPKPLEMASFATQLMNSNKGPAYVPELPRTSITRLLQ